MTEMVDKVLPLTEALWRQCDDLLAPCRFSATSKFGFCTVKIIKDVVQLMQLPLKTVVSDVVVSTYNCPIWETELEVCGTRGIVKGSEQWNTLVAAFGTEDLPCKTVPTMAAQHALQGTLLALTKKIQASLGNKLAVPSDQRVRFNAFTDYLYPSEVRVCARLLVVERTAELNDFWADKWKAPVLSGLDGVEWYPLKPLESYAAFAHTYDSMKEIAKTMAMPVVLPVQKLTPNFGLNYSSLWGESLAAKIPVKNPNPFTDFKYEKEKGLSSAEWKNLMFGEFTLEKDKSKVTLVTNIKSKTAMASSIFKAAQADGYTVKIVKAKDSKNSKPLSFDIETVDHLDPLFKHGLIKSPLIKPLTNSILCTGPQEDDCPICTFNKKYKPKAPVQSSNDTADALTYTLNALNSPKKPSDD